MPPFQGFFNRHALPRVSEPRSARLFHPGLDCPALAALTSSQLDAQSLQDWPMDRSISEPSGEMRPFFILMLFCRGLCLDNRYALLNSRT